MRQRRGVGPGTSGRGMSQASVGKFWRYIEREATNPDLAGSLKEAGLLQAGGLAETMFDYEGIGKGPE